MTYQAAAVIVKHFGEIHILRCNIQRAGPTPLGYSDHSTCVPGANLGDPFGLLQIFERLVLHPCEWRVMIARELLVTLGLLKRLRMLFF